MPAPSVTVIVPAYNAEATLPACLAALGRMTYPASEVLVFSDGSTDRTLEIAEASGARVIRNNGLPRGPAHGRNAAAREATSDLLLFVDADVVIGEECLEKLVAAMQEHDAAAAFASYDDAPASTRLAGLYANLRHHFTHQHSAQEATTFWSGVGLIGRQLFLDLGGYDEAQFAHPSIEDVELGMRLKAAGHRIRLVPEALAKHCKDWSLWRVWHTDVVRRALPWSRLLMQGKTEGADLNLSSAERIKALASVGTFATLIAALLVPLSLLLAAALFACYYYLNRRFFGVLRANLTTGQWIRAVLLHLCYHAYSLGAYLWVAAEHTLARAFGGGRERARAAPARIDGAFVLCVACLTLLFSWAIILYGKPAYFDDTAGYLSGGEKIFQRLFELLGFGAGGPAVGGAGGGTGGGDGGGTSAARSLPYYVLTYLFSAPHKSLLLLGIFQSAVAAFYVVLHCRLENLRTGPIIVLGAVLALATPVALVTAFTVPDVFAVPIIGGITLLALRFERIAPLLRIGLVLAVGMSISTHVSYPPLALVMTGAALAWLASANRRAIAGAFPGALLAGLPLVLALAVTMVGGLVTFGEASVAPKRLPLVLARSMSDGPGRWYLEKTCPTKHYAVCEIWPDGNFPRYLGPILFQDGGILRVATDEQLERIREEEPEIVYNALQAYPMFQVKKSLSSVGRQIVTFHPFEINFDRQIYRDADGTLRTSKAERHLGPAIRFNDLLTYVLVPLSALLLLVAVPLMPRRRLPTALLCALGILANLVICAVFSAVASRYATRVLWMLPLLAALYAWAPLRDFVMNRLGRAPASDEPAAANVQMLAASGGKQR